MAETGTATIEIEASPKRILEVITDIESYPQWMSAFKKAEVLESDGKGRPLRAQFEVDAMIKRVHYILEYKYSKNAVSWESAEGDVKEINGSYTLDIGEGVTRVTYSYSIDPGFPIPGFLKRQAVRMMVGAALDDLKERSES